MKILVLGAGRMGLGVVHDLIHNSEVESVTVADVDFQKALSVAETVSAARVTPVRVDVEDYAQVVGLMRGHAAAVSCVVYLHNVRLAEAAIEAQVNFCDLGGNNDVVAAELALDERARAAGINIIPDCGLAPGMVSLLVADGAARFDSLDEIHIRVGGLPQRPKPPLNYQVVFAVEGLINEYVEPARVIRDGRIVEVDSMTEVESLEFPPPFGRLEAFQTSGGTSTLPETFLGKVRELDYKTIRYPGHAEQFRLLFDLGLAGGEEIAINGKTVVPRSVLGELLRRRLPADEPDAVLIRVEFRGLIGGARRSLVYTVVDLHDEATGLSAMMRTTAFPASIVAQTMARGETTARGAIPQERCVPAPPFIASLAKRGIRINEGFVD